jgi:hypothetical protein
LLNLRLIICLANADFLFLDSLDKAFPDMASRYNLVEYDSDEDRETYPVVPLANLLSAAVFMATLFDRAGIPYAVMGGFAVKLMGGTRDTRDVDIAFQGKMGDLWKVVENEPRYAYHLWPVRECRC